MFGNLIFRIRSIFKRNSVEREMDEELRAHIQDRADDLHRSGLPRVEAERHARIEFGAPERFKEECREALGSQLLDALWQDFRFGIRMLLKSPGFTIVAILTLALGIGANTAVFSVVNQVILHPLPYAHPENLVLVFENIPMLGGSLPMPPVDIQEIQTRGAVFESSASFETVDVDLSGFSLLERAPAARISPNTFSLLGAAPIMGRTFTETEDHLAQPVVVLSYALWQTGFGGSPNVMGKTLLIDRKPYNVIGVMPRQFVFPPPMPDEPETPQLWIPMSFTRTELAGRDWYDFNLIGRLKPGVSPLQAQAGISTICDEMYSWMAKQRASLRVSARVLPLQGVVVKNAKSLLLLLLAATFLVLMIACANIASLLLARSSGRRREIAVRLALGTTRTRLVRMLFVEHMSLAVIGGLAGLWLATLGVTAFVGILPATIPQVGLIHADARVIVFAVLLSGLTGLLFGIFPALAMSRVNTSEALKDAGRGHSSSGFWSIARGAIVISQVALALVLLMGGSLVLRSFVRLQQTQPGFQPQNVLTMSITLPKTQYTTGTLISSFYQELLARMSTLANVQNVAMATDIPLHGTWRRIFEVEGHPLPPNSSLRLISTTAVLGNYFETLGIPLKAGRTFDSRDGSATLPVVIISEGMAKLYWPGENPVGKRMRYGSTLPWLTIVGVVADVKQSRLDQEFSPHTYFPYLQFGDDGLTSPLGHALALIIKTKSAPLALLPGVRAQVQALDPQEPIANARTMDEIIRRSAWSRRFNTLMFGGFACVALFLASAGLYGLVSYTVNQRKQEIGIRVALGAQRLAVLRIVLLHGLRLATAGLGIGLLLSLAFTRFIASLLFRGRTE
jgi:predicted permease